MRSFYVQRSLNPQSTFTIRRLVGLLSLFLELDLEQFIALKLT